MDEKKFLNILLVLTAHKIHAHSSQDSCSQLTRFMLTAHKLTAPRSNTSVVECCLSLEWYSICFCKEKKII